MRVVIIAGGSFEPCFDIRYDDFVICADSGYDYAIKYGIQINLLLGDMDSVRSDTQNVKDKTVFPTRKDFTDSEIAVQYAIKMKPDEVVMLGCTGTRADHSLGNIFLLKQLHDAGINGHMTNKNNDIFFYRNEFLISGRKGQTVSLIPITGEIKNISTYGLDYPLNNETLHFGETRGISNVIVSDNAWYKSQSGDGILVFAKI